LPGADTSEAFDRDRLEIGAWRCDRLVADVAKALLSICSPSTAAENLGQRRRALTGCEDEIGPVAARLRPVKALVLDAK
jgi:hypothetical protein